MKLTEAVERLEAAVRRLEKTAETGPRARRNARSDLARALRAVRDAADEQYPSTTPRKARSSRAGLSPQRREMLVQRKLRRDGFVPMGELSPANAPKPSPALLAAARVRVVIRGKPQSHVLWVPKWARGFFTVPDLERAKKDVRWREARLAALDAERLHPQGSRP